MSHSTNSRESCECKENLRLLSLLVLTALLALSVGAFGQTQGPTVRLKASNGQYVVAEGGGGGAVNANRPQAGAWETFTLIDKNGSPLMNGDAVNFRTATGHFLVAEGSGGREVLANRPAAGPWETFVIVKVRGSAGQEIVHGDAIALRASNGQYVVAEGGGGGVVNANRNAIGPWETFVLEVVGVAAPPPPPPPPTVGVTPTRPLGPRVGPLPGVPTQPPRPPTAPGQQPTAMAAEVGAVAAIDTRPAGPPPTNVTATAPGPTTVSLRWNAAANAVGYLIQRGTDLLTQAPINALTYTDSGRAPKTTYSYTVAAVYSHQGPNSPGWSAPVNVSTPPILPPDNLQATVKVPNTVVLSWSPRPDAYGYRVLRDGKPMPQIVQATTFTDQLPGPGSYRYQVASYYQGIGDGVPSSAVRAGTPIWGFADTHTHQFANQAFGGAFAGSPYGQIDRALPRCDFYPGSTLLEPKPFHGPWGTFDVFGSSLTVAAGIGGWGHDVAGYPEFNGWPRWNTITHQQMYADWLKRALDGGLKLIVMHAVNNEVICRALGQGLSCNDMEAVNRQLNHALAMERVIDNQNGGPGKGWYRIVYSPEQARQAIYEGKLAVVLGIEVDNLFNCRETGGCSEATVRDQLDYYYDRWGVRHMHPIHFANNAFGGAALVTPWFNYMNRILTGNYFVPETCPAQDGIEFQLDDLGPVATTLVDFLGTRLGLSLPPPPPYVAPGHCNSKGLAQLGEVLIGEMMNKGMIIDVDHMSKNAINKVLDMAKTRKYAGIIAGHTGFVEISRGKDKRHESQKTDDQVKRIADLGGMVSTMLRQGKTHQIATYTPGSRAPIPHNCSNSTKSWLQAYLYVADKVKGSNVPLEAVGIATDFNGNAEGQPGPRFGDEACTATGLVARTFEVEQAREGKRVTYPFQLPGMATLPKSNVGQKVFNFDTDGLAHVGMLPDFIQDARVILGNDNDLRPLFRSAEAYIQIWEKAERAARPAPPPAPLYLHLDYGARSVTGGSVTVFAADRATGAGVQGQVKLDTGESGSTGLPITFTFKSGPRGEKDEAGQPIVRLFSIKGTVSAQGYQDVNFWIPAPERSMILQVQIGPASGTQRTATVTAMDAETRAAVNGVVTIGRARGNTGQQISYARCMQSEEVIVEPPEVQTETDPVTGEQRVHVTKPRVTRPPSRRPVLTEVPCGGAVRALGYIDEYFAVEPQP